MQNDGNYIKIDLVRLAEGLMKRAWLIVIAMLLCGSIAFSAAAFFIKPMYQSNVLLYVNNSSFSVGSTSFSISSSEISAAKSLVDTYMVILKTRLTLNEVIELGELEYTYEELKEMIHAEAVNDTEVFSVSVTSDDPFEAEHIANTIGQVLPGKIADVVEGSSVRIVDFAVVPSEKVSPSIRKYTMVGLLVGIVLSCTVVLIIEAFDDQIHSEDYLLEHFKEIPLLAVVPDMLEKHGNDSYYYYEHTPGRAKAENKGRVNR